MLNFLVLAAGKGSRMKSDLPKVLQPLAGKPLLEHVLSMTDALQANVTIVAGHKIELIQQRYAANYEIVEQKEQLGTGHAVECGLNNVSDDDLIIVLYGDVPLLSEDTIRTIVKQSETAELVVLSVILENPRGYGRILRDAQGDIIGIVEEKDATEEQKLITEVNTGIMAASAENFRSWLSKVTNDNTQGEYYLTDCVALAVNEQQRVDSVICQDALEVQGVNSKSQLMVLERALQRRNAERLLQDGVTIMDANRIDIRGELSVGRDVSIDVNAVFEGKVSLGNRVTIGANCVLNDCTIADDTTIAAFSHIEGASIGVSNSIGPFARLRPGTETQQEVKIGNFVETKKALIDAESKISHLSYVGDAVLGKDVNIGAGTITCNYDGVNKHKTVIGDHVFVGSDTQLVAPVEVGAGATIGAGSTIVKDVPEDKLTLSRSKQLTVKGWKRPIKK